MKTILSALAMVAVLSVSVFAQPTTQPAATEPASKTAAKPLPAEQMLGQMLKPSAQSAKPLEPTGSVTAPPAADATSGQGAVAPGAPVVTVLREGSFIVDRVGRLTRGTDGQQMEFSFDADGKAMQDPPLIILPNLKLMQMEDAVNGNSRDLKFRITGSVTEYRGRNYILLEKVVVVPDITQQF